MARICSVQNTIKFVECMLVAVLSIGGIVVGGLNLNQCRSSPFMPWWLLVHGIACTLYYLISVVTLLSIPFEINRLIEEVTTLERLIGSILDSIGMPAGRHFIRDESPVSSFQEAVCNEKSKQKLYWSELAFAFFGVFFLCSLCFGIFVSVLPALGRNCNRHMHIYSLTLIAVSLVCVIIKVCRALL